MTKAIKSKWLVFPKPQPAARLRLFCLPFAGGSSNAFRNWTKYLPSTVELCSIELPGRGSRLSEALRHSLPELLPEISAALEPHLDLPFVFFGHSMGTLLAFELNYYLRQQLSKSASHIFLSGRGAPHLADPEPPIHQLGHDDFISKIKEYNGTPKQILEHRELMELMVPILRADFEICETYRFEADEREPFDQPLTIFGGLKDSSTPRPVLEAWSRYTTSTFQVRMFPGDHFYLLDSEMLLIQTMLRDIGNHFNF